jgi:hypothetical protein
MPTIFDQFATSPSPFRPTDVCQYTALQIARLLGEQPNLRKYLIASEQYSPSVLAAAYKNTKRMGGGGNEFFSALKHN